MRIALNMVFVVPRLAGGRVYCEELLRGLAEIDPDNEYLVYTRRNIRLPQLPQPQFRQIEVPVGEGSVLWRTAWEYGCLPRQVRADGSHLFHGLGSLSPLVRGRLVVLTIHDLIYHHFPQSVSKGQWLFSEWVLPLVARRAQRIIVPSRFTAKDVVENLGVRPERVRLVPYGPGIGFARQDDEDLIRQRLAHFKVRRPYIVSVCRGYPHKNLAGLLRAYAVLRGCGHRDVQLVLVGERHWSGGVIDALIQELDLASGVLCTGRVSQEDLNILYSAATVFAFPSLAEGLGLPVLEAMGCGVPVVASNAMAIPEGVGEAGILVDARDPEAFALALEQVLVDETLQATLRQKGLAHVKTFSWRRCAEQTLAVYREVSENRMEKAGRT